MQFSHGWIAMGLITLSCLFLSACEQHENNEVNEPVKIESIAGSELHKLTLTADAAKRLNITVAPVREMQGGTTAAATPVTAQVPATKPVTTGMKKVVPYSSVIYDPEGVAWVYVTTQPLTYMRAQIEIDSIVGDDVFLVSGPATGTSVVTVGPSELYGAEFMENIEP